MSNKRLTVILLVILAVVAALAILWLHIEKSEPDSVKASAAVLSTGTVATSTLSVQPNYGVQTQPNVIQVTAPTAYFQGK